jgi:hypothetical protein
MRLDVVVVVATELLTHRRGTDRGSMRFDIVVVATELLAYRRGTDRGSVTLDVLLLWLQILTWLVRHFFLLPKLC